MGPTLIDKFERLNRHLDKIAPDIGYLVIAFNSLEESLDRANVEYFNPNSDTKGYAVIYGLSFSSKVELLSRMVLYGLNIAPSEKRKRVLLKEFEELLQSLRNANSIQNDVIHAAWMEYDLSTRTVRTKIKIETEGVTPRSKRIEPKDTRNARRRIEKLTENFEAFFEKRGSWW